ncbi:MAG: SRPBCC family protein [Solirubrobacterales bacterium]|nr:SRPBCC family protein [Solirubrobacterales bacterium]
MSEARGYVGTRTLSVAAAPDQAFALLSDPYRLPQWAPGIAESVAHEHEDVWRLTSASGTRLRAIRTSAAFGVVDFVSPEPGGRGLFIRVLANAGGSELVFSMAFPPGTPQADIDAQMTAIERELQTVRTLLSGY